MTVGAFELVNSGLLGHLDGSIDPESAAMYAVLTTDASGAPNVATDIDYADITAGEPGGGYDQQVAALDVTEPSPGITMVNMDQVNFGDTVTIDARYFWILQGNFAAPGGTDRILGFMDLNFGGSGDVSSVASDFKVDANANGLYRVAKA